LASQRHGTSSAAQSSTLTNISNAAVPISSIALTGTGASQFAFTDICGASLARMTNCTINAAFKPTIPDAETARVKVSGGGAGTRTVSLAGTGM
jgi:hypothetical protein